MSLNSEEFEDDSSLEDKEGSSYNKRNSLGLCMDELEDDWEDKEEGDISFNFDELEDGSSLGSDDESFYSGDHIGGISFVESDNDNWSTVLSASTRVSSKCCISSVSTRYHDNMSGNESESLETPLVARTMAPRRAMTSVPGDMITESKWDEARAMKQLAKAGAMFGVQEPAVTILLAFENVCIARDAFQYGWFKKEQFKASFESF